VYLKNLGETVGKRADFLIKRTSTRDPSQLLGAAVVELKCESLHNEDKFKNAVEKDIQKVTSYALKSEVAPARVWVMAISVSRGGFEEMSKIFTQAPMVVCRERDEGMPVRLWIQEASDFLSENPPSSSLLLFLGGKKNLPYAKAHNLFSICDTF
jgi:hypothetical protein